MVPLKDRVTRGFVDRAGGGTADAVMEKVAARVVERSHVVDFIIRLS